MKILGFPAWIFPVLALVLALHIGFSAALIQRSNQDPAASDQGAEMWLTALARQDPFPLRTDGVRHPLYSWLLRGIWTDDASALFARGKWLNVLFCAAFLAALGLAASRWLDPLATINLLLLSTLGFLVVRGTYYQPEPLYAVLIFCCIVLGWRLLRGAPSRWRPLFGLLCGLAFLAKPSVLPFLMAFFFGAAVKGIATRVLCGRLPRVSLGSLGASLAGIVLFAALITPLGIFSKQHFGRAFFNFPQYWMWMDDFDTQAWPWQDAHPGRAQLETIPPDQMPSLRWYAQRHSPGDAFARLGTGLREVGLRFLFPEPKKPLSTILWRTPGKKWEQPLLHRGIYLMALLLLTLLLSWPPNRSLPWRDPGFLGAAAFAAALLGGFWILYGWYWPIGRGDRFMGSLWMPTLFLLIRAGSSLQPASSWRKAYPWIHSAILASILLQATSLTILLLQGGSLVTKN